MNPDEPHIPCTDENAQDDEWCGPALPSFVWFLLAVIALSTLAALAALLMSVVGIL